MPRGTLFHRPSPTLLPSTSAPPVKTIETKRSRRGTKLTSKQILLLTAIFLFLTLFFYHPTSGTHGQARTWHGGHPSQDRTGSCWCGDEDGYCMCTPALSVDIVLYEKVDDEYNVWVVKRKDTGQFATIGGFVEVGETPVEALLREVSEETGIVIPTNLAQAHGHSSTTKNESIMRLIGVYSDPRRDSRRSNVSTAYALEFDSAKMSTKDGLGKPKAGDDAKEVVSIPMKDVGTRYTGDDWFADHLTILLDFKEQLMGEGLDRSGLGELADDVKRSTCS